MHRVFVPMQVLIETMWAKQDDEQGADIIDDFMGSYRDPIGPHPFVPPEGNYGAQLNHRECRYFGCGTSKNSPIHFI